MLPEEVCEPLLLSEHAKGTMPNRQGVKAHQTATRVRQGTFPASSRGSRYEAVTKPRPPAMCTTQHSDENCVKATQNRKRT